MNNNTNHNKEKAALEAVSLLQGVSLDEVRQSIQEVIDTTWSQSEGAERRAELFPDGKPGPEDFIRTLVAVMREEDETRKTDPNLKLLNARDFILAYLMNLDLWKDEAETVLQMCQDEMNAWEKRSKFDVL